MANLIVLTTFDYLACIKAIPFGPLPWTCDNCRLVLVSVVAECNVYNKSSLLLS